MSEENSFELLGVQLPSKDGVVTIDQANLGKLKDRMGLKRALKSVSCVAKPIGCGREISVDEIKTWDSLSIKEYSMSGLCKTPCQDKAFADPDEKKIDNVDPTCTCSTPCCEADIGVGVIDCGSQHCAVHGNQASAFVPEPNDDLIPEEDVV